MVFPLKVRLTASIIIVVLAMGVVSTVIGTRLFGDSLVEQVQSRVEQDLATAYLVYDDRVVDLESIIELMAGEALLIRRAVSGNHASLSELLSNHLVEWNLDVLTVTDANGIVLARGTENGTTGDDLSTDQVIARVIASREHVSGTSTLGAARLVSESPELAARAHIPLRETERARPSQRTILDEGMVLNAGAPILVQGKLVGVLYGGILLNRQEEMVDRIKETAYAGETWRGKEVGTATIFQNDVRIATNVMDEDGNRAIGTRVSSEVYEAVIEAGDRWIARAFVVNNWCIAGYGPIYDLEGKTVGIIYVGILAAKFDALRERTVLTFAGVSIAGMILALIIAGVLTTGILRPLRSLRLASQEIAAGKLDTRVDMGPNAADEFLEVADAFNTMVESIAERDAQLQENARKMTESKKLATLGQLAAGIAHEINNPLGGILMYSHMLREDLVKEENRENVEKIGREADRCKKIVKGLLDFARQTKPERTVSNISLVINEVIALLEHQAIFHNIEIVKDFDPSIPLFDFDVTQIQEVFMNLILNSAQAMDGRGTLTITAQLVDNSGSVLVEIRDTGPGIPAGNIDKIFEPFFTTKEIGCGTGLGLAIAYGIIERHHGTIWVESRQGEGTSFFVKLPAGGNVPPM